MSNVGFTTQLKNPSSDGSKWWTEWEQLLHGWLLWWDPCTEKSSLRGSAGIIWTQAEMSSAVSRFLLKIIINKTKQNQTLLLETTDVETAFPVRSWKIPDSFFEAPALRKMTRLFNILISFPSYWLKECYTLQQKHWGDTIMDSLHKWVGLVSKFSADFSVVFQPPNTELWRVGLCFH